MHDTHDDERDWHPLRSQAVRERYPEAMAAWEEYEHRLGTVVPAVFFIAGDVLTAIETAGTEELSIWTWEEWDGEAAWCDDRDGACPETSFGTKLSGGWNDPGRQ